MNRPLGVPASAGRVAPCLRALDCSNTSLPPTPCRLKAGLRAGAARVPGSWAVSRSERNRKLSMNLNQQSQISRKLKRVSQGSSCALMTGARSAADRAARRVREPPPGESEFAKAR